LRESKREEKRRGGRGKGGNTDRPNVFKIRRALEKLWGDLMCMKHTMKKTKKNMNQGRSSLNIH
jgi:hypothetical protein